MPAASPPVLVDLPDNALIAVTGDDATTFLQGQLTNDVAALKVGEAQWTGWCSPKGRLIASFLLVKRADGYLAMLPAELAPAIAKKLSMYVLRSKVKIADVSAQYERAGLVGAGRPDLGSIEVGRNVHVAIEPAAGSRLALLRSASTPGTIQDWTLALIHAGIPTVVAATQDEFVPQMANFDLIGAVSFRKGCYTGQEIVARTQYRGILKKRMAIAHVDGAMPAPGQSVYSAAFGEQSAGTVANVAPAPGGGYDLLVVAQIEGLREGNLRLGSPDGAPLAIRSHPPLDAAAK
jgi:folate-binding protein YgfZ